MQLYELEISNYKCLDNFGMPLKFSNLNLLIGENDAGKTSLLEVIEIILKNKEVHESMFFNRNRDLRLKVRFNNIDRKILSDALSLQQLEITFRKYLEIINIGSDPYEGYKEFLNNCKSISFSKGIERLSDYSFYNDLKLFYKNYIQYPIINGILHFGVNNEVKGKIDINSFAYFDINIQIKEFLNKLLENIEFFEFMRNNLNEIDNICYNNLQNFIKSEVPPRFIDDCNFLVNNTGILSGNRESSLFKILKRLYLQKIFIDDSEEVIISKIAKILSYLINNKNSDDTWDIDTSLQLGNHWIDGYDTFTTFEGHHGEPVVLVKDLSCNEFKNIFSNYFVKKEYKWQEKKERYLPEIKTFSSEIINERVPSRLFDDLFGGIEKLNDFIYWEIADYLKELNNKIETEYFNKFSKPEIKNELIEIMKNLGENIKDFDISVNIKELEEFEFGVNIDRMRVKEIIKPSISMNINEDDNKIDIVQKSQGFLRKLLLADFLLLLKESDKDEDISKIILIEEPELHLHCNAQRIIMKLVKENLWKGNNQLFITSHSHFIIENIDFENIFIFKKEKKSRTASIRNILNYSSNTEIVKELQETLGLKKTDLLFMKKLIIILEGKNDIAFIKGLCKRPDINVNSEEILFLEAKGQANINYYIGLGDFLKIKVLVILDNHIKNYKTREKILKNPYKSKELTDSILKIEILDKPDMLDYLDIKMVEEYYNLPKGFIKIDKDKITLKDFLWGKNIKIKSEHVEFLVSQTKKIDKEIEKKVIDLIKLFKIQSL